MNLSTTFVLFLLRMVPFSVCLEIMNAISSLSDLSSKVVFAEIKQFCSLPVTEIQKIKDVLEENLLAACFRPLLSR